MKMKKYFLPVLLLLFVSITVIAEPPIKGENIRPDIPEELHGVWYTIAYSKDQGRTVTEVYKPMFLVSSRIISSSTYADEIVAVEIVTFNEGPGYVIYSKKTSTVYIITFIKSSFDIPLLYIYKNKEETFRGYIAVVKT